MEFYPMRTIKKEMLIKRCNVILSVLRRFDNYFVGLLIWNTRTEMKRYLYKNYYW